MFLWVGLGFGRDTKSGGYNICWEPRVCPPMLILFKAAWGMHGSHELRVQGRTWICLHCRRRGPPNRGGRWRKRCS